MTDRRPAQPRPEAAAAALVVTRLLRTGLAFVMACFLAMAAASFSSVAHAAPPEVDPMAAVDTYAVGDHVWVDRDRDGFQGEHTMLDGVTVTLFDGVGAELATTTTDENGRYLFDELPAGDYQVGFTLTEEQAAIYAFTTQDKGEDDADDSDVDPATGLTSVFTLDEDTAGLVLEYSDQDVTATGGIDATRDAGVIVPPEVTVGDFVWIDSDGDGWQSGGEPGIPGVVLTITGPDGEPVVDGFGNTVGPAMTDAHGRYTFSGLPTLVPELSYTVTIDQVASAEALAPYTPTLEGRGFRSSDSSTWSATTLRLNLDGYNDLTLDFGFVGKTYAVGDHVWVDRDRDGFQGEPLVLADVSVTLLNGEGAELATTTTDENGRYLFDELPAGDYQVGFTLTEEQAAIYAFTTQDKGEDDADDSDVDPATGLTSVFTLDEDTAGLALDYTDQEFSATHGIDPTRDAGVIVPPEVSVGNFVWFDENVDGRQNDGETGIPGVVLDITGPDGGPVIDVLGSTVGSTVTDEAGLYSFDKLPLLERGEIYTVTIDQVASAEVLSPFVPTAEGQGHGGIDSSTWSATTIGLLLTGGNRDRTLDFGFVLSPEPIVSVGDYVWVDENNDGLQTEGEPGIPGVVLGITDPAGQLVTDVNGDPVAPVTTGENGEYSVENLPVLDEDESYTVTIDEVASAEALSLYVPTIETDDARENDSSSWFATTEGLSADGERDPTLDFGFVQKTYAVGDVVWIDDDGNGTQDDDELLAGVTVRLLDGEGAEVATTTTGENGTYLFDELPAGEYQIAFELTAEQAALYTFTGQNSGEENWADSDADPETGLTVVFTLDGANTSVVTDYPEQEYTASQGVDSTRDAGVVLIPEPATVSVGDFVWVDENNDGRQGEDETGLPGVTVTLLNGEGAELATTTTDEKGRYQFDELLPGDYQVGFTLTAEQAAIYQFTGPDAGEDDAADSDANPKTGRTAVFTLVAPTESLSADSANRASAPTAGIDPTRDAGVVLIPEPATVSVGDFVWVDENNDGRQSEGESGIPDVVLELIGPDGALVNDEPVGPVTTGESGEFTFENLPVLEEGQSYTVSIDREASAEALAPYVPTISGEGDREFDSSEWTAATEGLTESGQSDPTLDFGFVLIPEPVDPEPTDPEPTDPAPTDPVPTEPAPTDPVPTEPAPTEPVPTDPAPTDPAPTDPVPTDPVPTVPQPEPSDDTPEVTPAAEAAPEVEEGDKGLARTGFEALGLLAAALLLVAGGAALIIRRQRGHEG